MDHDADDLNNIVLPLMNVERRTKNGTLNPREPQQIQLWMTSASDKNTFCYDKVIEMLELSIINPTHSFLFGCNYQVPMQVGLLPKNFLNEIKTSQTFSEESFAKEYLSQYIGSSSDAWFSFEKLNKRRRLINPEMHEFVRDGINSYYILSVDIARLKCQTVAMVLKVYPDSDYRCSLVNIEVLGKTEDEKILDKQAIALKQLIQRYNPKEVVLDINGIGIFFADAMIKETFDPVTGITYPAYGFFNREKDYENIQPRNCKKILFGIKANTQINSDMHSILFSKIDNGKISFLISEKDAKNKLNATKVGQRLKPEQKIARLMPHELTSILFDEMMNLKIKPAGANNMIAVEQINKRMTKDKFSALEMGTYRISLIETEEISHQRNRGMGRKLVFFKSGGGKY